MRLAVLLFPVQQELLINVGVMPDANKRHIFRFSEIYTAITSNTFSLLLNIRQVMKTFGLVNCL
jgi:hypothetical protein